MIKLKNTTMEITSIIFVRFYARLMFKSMIPRRTRWRGNRVEEHKDGDYGMCVGIISKSTAKLGSGFILGLLNCHNIRFWNFRLQAINFIPAIIYDCITIGLVHSIRIVISNQSYSVNSHRI